MNKQPVALAELAELAGGTLEGKADTPIVSAAPIETAAVGDISFVANKKYEKFIDATRASALVLNPQVPCDRVPVIRHVNPYLAFARIISRLYPETQHLPSGVHQTAVVEPSASIDSSAAVGPFCRISDQSRIGGGSQLISDVYVGKNATIGERCVIYPGVRIMDDTHIGNDVRIYSGAVIGSDGFGFAQSDTGPVKVRQVGWVEIGDEVEIGANTTIDRGALGATSIGRGTKIDNLVQIAHNVRIGENCIIISQVGISGSTRLGDRVVLAGQVGLVGHIELGDGVVVAAKSGIHKSVPPGKTMFGYPARDIMLTKRIDAAESRLPDLFKRVKRLEQQVRSKGSKP